MAKPRCQVGDLVVITSSLHANLIGRFATVTAPANEEDFDWEVLLSGGSAYVPTKKGVDDFKLFLFYDENLHPIRPCTEEAESTEEADLRIVEREMR